MLTIRPISDVPSARDNCIVWCDREWGEVSGLSPSDWIDEFQRIERHPVDEAFVATEEETPVGMVWMLEHEGLRSHRDLRPWVSNLIVDPKHRERGIARALLAHAETYIAAGGDDLAYLLTQTPAVYFNHGWEVIDTAPLGKSHVFVMQKALAGEALSKQDQEPDKKAGQG
ncbi:MAG: GNAT family N-acetyltransferase [Paracoccaceae bacterium]